MSLSVFAFVLGVLAISTASLLVWLSIKRRRSVQGGPWHPVYLFSTSADRAYHPTTLLVEAGFLFAAGIALILWF